MSEQAAFDIGTQAVSEDVARDAVVSDDGQYRYLLTRIWGDPLNLVTWIMLNPSTADANIDDPTIRRCIGFARHWGYDGIRVANLYAYRATDPKALWATNHPVGWLNDLYLALALESAHQYDTPVVAAWGANAKPDRIAQFLELPNAERTQALGVTKDGQPRHPLYLRADSILAPWPPTIPDITKETP